MCVCPWVLNKMAAEGMVLSNVTTSKDTTKETRK